MPSTVVLNIHALPPLFTAVAILVIGLIVVFREKGTRVSLLYLTFTLAASGWMFCAGMALSMASGKDAFTWMKFANAWVAMIPASLYHFTAVVLQRDQGDRLRVIAAWAFSAFFLSASLMTDLLFDGFHHYSWGIFLQYRPPALLFIAYFLAAMAASLRMYWMEYRLSDRNSTRHRRASAFLIAFGIGCLGTLDFLPALGVPYYPLSSIPMLCMLILASRAIWRYRLVDITPAFAANEIINTMSDALIVLDTEGMIRVVNRTMCGWLGRREQDLIGKRPADGMDVCREFAGTIDAAASSGTVRYLEVQCHFPQGAQRILSLSTSHMRNAAGERVGTVCLINDITDRKRSEEDRDRLIAELRTANAKLRSMDKMKSYFLSTVSHELRTPLTTIKAFVELLLIKQEMPADQKLKLMTTVNIEADRLSRLIADLLDLSRIEAGSMKWQLGEVQIEELVRSVTASMAVLFESKNVNLTSRFAPPLSRIRGDRDRLVQVVTNILSNALKFTPEDGAVHVSVRQEESPRQIVVEVSDTGIGIPAEHIELIFEKFHRSDDRQTSMIEGTGLGLAITRQIVEYHGGRIWAASTQGKGTVFTFTLPLQNMRNAEFEIRNRGSGQNSL